MDIQPLIDCREVLLRTGSAWPAIYGVVPLRLLGDKLVILAGESFDRKVQGAELELLTGKQILFEPALDSTVKRLLDIHFGDGMTQYDPATAASPGDLIAEAVRRRASDIHLESLEYEGRIRLRIDGRLREAWVLEADRFRAVVNQVKIKAGLDISQRRLPQDGRIEAGRVDVRVSSIPGLYGEKLVLRLLHRETGKLTLEKLGMQPGMLKEYLDAAHSTHGMILISGPTGSGKTTTLYATIRALFDPGLNILTIEDPVEYRLDGVTQAQVNEKIGLDFPVALRAFLRQDPDIIMIGEIRDAVSARIAVRAALTGHLVLTTVHTNSAAETFTRLADMGIEPFLLASTVKMSMAQRLVRKLCPSCRIRRDAPPPSWPGNAMWPATAGSYYEPAGCSSCQYTGFSGQVAMFDMLIPDARVKELVRNNRAIPMNNQGGLAAQALQLAIKGLTSPSEIISIINTQAG